MDEGIRCFSVFAGEYVKSFPVFCGMICGVEVVAGFNPLSGFLSFEVISDCSLELSMKAQ